MQFPILDVSVRLAPNKILTAMVGNNVCLTVTKSLNPSLDISYKVEVIPKAHFIEEITPIVIYTHDTDLDLENNRNCILTGLSSIFEEGQALTAFSTWFADLATNLIG